MIAYLRRHLGIKLFLSYLIVILVGVVILASTTQFALPGAFERHMIRMGTGMGPGMMGAPGAGLGQAEELYLNFRASFNEALALAVFVSAALALVVSMIFSRGVIAPVQAMMSVSQRISEGHYNERVQVRGEDELSQLARRFNTMAGQLEQIETMRRQLIGDVAHELRTPLTAIKGSMEGLMDGVLPASDETFGQIHQEADRLSHLVDDLQELSRVEAATFKLDLRPVAVVDLVNSALGRLSRQYEEKGVTLTSGLPADLPLVQVDEDRVGQVLLNLIGNALQYTPAGGNVQISAVRDGDEVRIMVTDTGIGLPAEHIPHIFDRFYRADKSRSRRAGGGSGIGLTIARHLVEAHGGRIWAESEGEGQGSKFTFTVKAAK
ncbi:MAG: cell wall metabolism sensor histidine kinase WalK [Chloroflexi bacterium]|nr:cell wall metabolism sensor histidine kinase WalK [Chloroflexota bacterium]